MDVESERNKIEKFRIDFRVLTNEVQGLQKKLGAASFDLQKYEEEEKAWKASEIKLKEINEKVIGLRKDLIWLEKEKKEKKKLLKKLNELNRRFENQQVMYNLLKSSRIVQYVSKIL